MDWVPRWNNSLKFTHNCKEYVKKTKIDQNQTGRFYDYPAQKKRHLKLYILVLSNLFKYLNRVHLRKKRIFC